MVVCDARTVRADRLLQVVGLLRQHGRLSATELARRLEVTPRTVLRDMEALSTAGVPVVAERGRGGGFSLLPGYRPAVEELTASEVQALLLTGRVPADSLGLAGPLASALRKVAGSAPPEHGRSAARISDRVLVDLTGWWGAAEELEHFDAVQQAVLADRRLRLTYRPRDPTRTGVRTVDPYGLLQAAGTWYLIAGHGGRPRSYRLSRVLAATVLDEPSSRPADLDLRALWGDLRSQFAGPPGHTIRLSCDPARYELALTLLASQGAGRPRVLDDGPPVVFEVEVHVLRPTVGVLAGLGSAVRALAPPELLTMMVAVAEELLAAYPDVRSPAADPS
ncbi:Predicted DNA-binding transcriptional regulator YafY, contains an HTH and WYL domains [Friedmanniella luteola]|uniref:Predicted DNA-binding transcriptional regulator YafY, contains an HTH and WYL domains n=1 Tax=Friedmanniella luteola TaxID=546871 RepID=A0A1H1M841_9ACTN|nr:Predicted DNA-binding transcriptional regulator YafY, contains an HTH and WYL domains [Friedmanniella luteola]